LAISNFSFTAFAVAKRSARRSLAILHPDACRQPISFAVAHANCATGRRHSPL
jgi:hypothetical protein